MGVQQIFIPKCMAPSQARPYRSYDIKLKISSCPCFPTGQPKLPAFCLHKPNKSLRGETAISTRISLYQNWHFSLNYLVGLSSVAYIGEIITQIFKWRNGTLKTWPMITEEWGSEQGFLTQTLSSATAYFSRQIWNIRTPWPAEECFAPCTIPCPDPRPSSPQHALIHKPAILGCCSSQKGMQTGEAVCSFCW